MHVTKDKNPSWAFLNRVGLHGGTFQFPAGQSTDHGFTITVAAGGRKKVYRTQGFKETDHAGTPSWHLFTPFGFATLYATAMLPFVATDSSWSMVTGFTLLWSAWFLFTFFLVAAVGTKERGTRWRQWHACEHRVIGLLALEREPTIADMQRTAKTTMECGTSSMLLIAQILGVMAFKVWGYPDAPFLLFPMAISTLALAVMWVAPEWLRLLLVPFALLGLINLAPGLALERMLVLREPSRRQMEVGLQLVRRIRRQYPGLGKAH